MREYEGNPNIRQSLGQALIGGVGYAPEGEAPPNADMRSNSIHILHELRDLNGMMAQLYDHLFTPAPRQAQGILSDAKGSAPEAMPSVELTLARITQEVAMLTKGAREMLSRI